MTTPDLTEFIRLVRELSFAIDRHLNEDSWFSDRALTKAKEQVDAAISRLTQRTGPGLFDSESLTERGEE